MRRNCVLSAFAHRLSLGLIAILATAMPTWAAIGDAVADRAIGQSSFEGTRPHNIGAATFGRATGVAVDRSVSPNRVYVADETYSRVLGWSNVDALLDGAPADLVIGQASFVAAGCNREPFANYRSGSNPPTLDSLCQPHGLSVDQNGAVYVADNDNNRVVIFNDPFGTDGVADMVIGDAADRGPAADRLNRPEDVFVDAAGDVWVADTWNHRVLQFDGPLASTDLVADRVFGQVDFVTVNSSFSAPTQYASGVVVDDLGTLYVGTGSGVKQFDLALTDQQLDRVLGTSYCNDLGEASASTTCRPERLAVDSEGRLLVGDVQNSRVLVIEQPRSLSPASHVLGQPDFTTGYEQGLIAACNTGGVSASSLCLYDIFIPYPGAGYGYPSWASDLALDDAGRLYVADGLNHRVLRFDDPLNDTAAALVLGQPDFVSNSLPLVAAGEPGVAATSLSNLVLDREGSRLLVYGDFGRLPDLVIGQPDLNTVGCNSGGLNASSLCQPTAAVVDRDNTLWIADTGNHRVLRFDNWYDYDWDLGQWVLNTDADAVYGQPDFVTAACTGGAEGLCSPRGVAVDAIGVLYISDEGNHRVVRHVDPSVDAVADGVFGQTDFDQSGCNAVADPASQLCSPRGLLVDDSSTLYVADAGNNRVLMFFDAHAGDTVADRVYGQGGLFTSTACSAGTGGLCQPSAMAFDEVGNLYIADTENSRVLEFDAPLGGLDADRVFGQPDFASRECNGGGVSATTLCRPEGVVWRRDRLVVADTQNHRVLQYDAPFCLYEFRLAPGTGGPGISAPTKNVVRMKFRTAGVADDRMSFSGRNFYWEDEAFFNIDNPLFTLSTPTDGEIARVAVQEMDLIRSSERVETWRVRYLRNELDNGIDVFSLRERWIEGGFGTRDSFISTYRGRAVGLDLEGLSSSALTFQMQIESACFVTEMNCTVKTRSARCKSPR